MNYKGYSIKDLAFWRKKRPKTFKRWRYALDGITKEEVID